MRAFDIVSLSVSAAVLSVAAVACGGSSEEEGPSETPAAVVAAPPAASTPSPAPTSPPLIDPGPVTPTPPSTGTCGPSTLCLDVSSLRQGTTPHAGRLVLVWIPLAGGQKEIGYDVAFTGTEKEIQVPLGSVTPPSDANAFCDKREGGKCTGAIKMSFGLLAVAEDQNGNGTAELGENVLGLADANVLFSGSALKPPPKDFVWSGQPMTDAFPSGVEQGANVYISPNGSGLKTLVPASMGQRFKLQVCDSTKEQECSVKAPF